MRISTADLHFGKTSAGSGVVLDVCLNILEICKSRGIRKLDILGDLLDNQTIISFRVLAEEVGTFFARARSYGIEVNLLHGNHDGRDMKVRKPSNLRSLDLQGARLIDQITQDGPILWIPWIYEDESVKPAEDTKVILAHLAFNGFSMNSGPFVESDGIDPLLFNLKVYTGHFHKFQVRDNITYLGSPLQHSFSDTNTPKFIHVLDDDFNIVESISTNHLFPNHITLDMRSLDPHMDIPKGSRIKVCNVDPIDIEAVEKGMLATGAKTVEIHTIDKEFEEIEDAVYSSLTIDDAISEIILSKSADSHEELLEMHKSMSQKISESDIAR